MSRSSLEPTCRVLHRLLVANAIALARVHAVDRGIRQGRSTLRYQRKPVRLAASGFVINAIMFNGTALWFAIPDRDGPVYAWLEHHLADSIANQFCDATPRPSRGFAQRFQLFLTEVDLRFFHVCHFIYSDDTRQPDRPIRNVRRKYAAPTKLLPNWPPLAIKILLLRSLGFEPSRRPIFQSLSRARRPSNHF